MATTQKTTGFTMVNSTSPELNISHAPTTLHPTGASEISCFIDPQLVFIVAASIGGIILILLITTIVLACNISRLKRRILAPRPSRSNADLVSGAGYWGTERREGDIVGQCETSVLLEEVKADGEEEEIQDGEEEEIQDGDAGPSQYISTTNSSQNSECVQTTIQSSASRESCIDPINLENMPLMV